MKNQALTVRPAELADLPGILEIYDFARNFMRANGNPTQWHSNYPAADLLEEDIAAGNLYVVSGTRGVCGVFAFILGDDPTYTRIERGSWRSDTPYGTIHRIAGDGTGGIFRTALDYCRGQVSHIRVDTHEDNRPMQHLAQKHGFSRRGIIYTDDGTPRIAFDQLKEDGYGIWK